MSSFMHDEKTFNALGKYFKETIKMDSEFTDHLIFNLYQFEIISVNARYEENNRFCCKVKLVYNSIQI